MTASLTRRSGNASGAEPAAETLDERIRQAEERLIAREQLLQRRWRVFGRRVQRAVQPRRLVLPVAGGLLALVALCWALRGRKRVPVPADAASAPAAHPASRGRNWLRGAALILPMLPVAWRTRLHPNAADLIAEFAPPLVDWLFTPRRPAAAPVAAEAAAGADARPHTRPAH